MNVQITVNENPEPIGFMDFVILNDLDVEEALEIGEALAREGVFHGGGGAQAEFTLKLFTPPAARTIAA